MPRLDRIVMQGFKSFANRTVLPFPQGFNAICGPNGSGKSNVLDAIVFVLGIRSAKAIRAGKLEDLVFKGGRKREGAKYAAVSLYIDNTDATIPGHPPEIKVTRKVNSSGVSAYKINDETVNRRQVVDVLSNARIYADGHNIILQGDITNLIEMNPIERREIIDEVSGIAEFEDKKLKAEQEIAKVDEKLKEAKIILNEKRSTLEKLKKEEELAREYRNLEHDLRKMRASIVKRRMDFFGERLGGVKTRIDEEQQKIAGVDAELALIDKELDELQREERAATALALRTSNRELLDKISDLRTEVERRMVRIESAKREIERLDELSVLTGGESAAVKAVLGLKHKGIHGTIGTLLKVESAYKTAVEVAAGNSLYDVVVDTDETAHECIEYLKETRVGRATFLPLSKMGAREKSKEARGVIGKEGVIDFAINLVKYDSKYEIAFRHVFGETLVVENLETARRHMGTARIVTLDGELIQKSGSMTGGFWRKREGDESTRFMKAKADLEREVEKLDAELNKMQIEMRALREQEEKESMKVTEFESKLGTTVTRIDELRKSRNETFEKKLRVQNEIGRLSVDKAKNETELDNLNVERDAFKEFFDANEFYSEGTIETLERNKRVVLEKLDKIGMVNFKAIEDYESLKQLYEDLNKKVQTIEQEKQAVLEMASSIEQKRTQAFMETFNAINSNFSKIYTDLSGGEATLELETGGDIRSGLLIKARPEGKKELHLDAMSGGEKTMTALAFLFAVQMHKPAPFYILDEVDAALDKKNSMKVAELVKKYSAQAQFILITHNDVTMRMADRVYGISMEDGVSKAVALELPAT